LDFLCEFQYCCAFGYRLMVLSVRQSSKPVVDYRKLSQAVDKPPTTTTTSSSSTTSFPEPYPYQPVVDYRKISLAQATVSQPSQNRKRVSVIFISSICLDREATAPLSIPAAVAVAFKQLIQQRATRGLKASCTAGTPWAARPYWPARKGRSGANTAEFQDAVQNEIQKCIEGAVW
jgi:hypothetical protein